MNNFLWIYFLYLLKLIKGQQGTSDQISLVLREEWLARNLAEGELRDFYEEHAISGHQIQELKEKGVVLSKNQNFTIIRGLLKNENNTDTLMPSDLHEFVDFLSNLFDTTVFNKIDLKQMINQTDQEEVQFILMVPWKAVPKQDLSPKQKSKID